MGYKNDQFYRLPASEGNPNMGASNPVFLYPDSTIRTTAENGDLLRKKLEKGYIRQVVVDGSERPKKCRFQFNPQNISHGVSMSETLLNFFQQDPAQFAQPLAGNVSFSFTLLFDRSLEMNNYQGPRPDAANPWETGNPAQVGVLRDLAALYEVIGQGMSGSQRDRIQREIETTIQLESSDDEDADPESAVVNVPNFLDQNVGNSAFLIPLPVRLVFSSLYMVEGFVRDTQVTFTKFNSSLVPMQCAVQMTVNALYVGFAKNDTFLTYALNEREEFLAKEAAEQAAQQAAETRQDVRSVAIDTADLSQITLKVSSGTATNNPIFNWTPVITQGDFSLILSGDWDKAAHKQYLKELFESGKNVSFRWNSSVAIYIPDLASGAGPRSAPIWSASYSSPTYTSSSAWDKFITDEEKPNSGVVHTTEVPDSEYYYGQTGRRVWTVSATLSIDGITATGYALDVEKDTYIGLASPLIGNEGKRTLNLTWKINGKDVSELQGSVSDSSVSTVGES